MISNIGASDAKRPQTSSVCYDVIETDQVNIASSLDYCIRGGCSITSLPIDNLKEKDACKLFSAHIRRPEYITSAPKIVHRDLKLENLLLDRNRNVTSPTLGFAIVRNIALMISCRLAVALPLAAQVVISEGSYVGSARRHLVFAA